MSIKVYNAYLYDDAEEIAGIIAKFPEHAVSAELAGYTADEVMGLIDNNEVWVAVDDDEKTYGFAIVKRMTNKWALLDRLFVLPEFRGQDVAQHILAVVRADLYSEGCANLSTFVDINDKALHGALEHVGFVRQKDYALYDLSLEAKVV